MMIKINFDEELKDMEDLDLELTEQQLVEMLTKTKTEKIRRMLIFQTSER